MAKKRRTAQTLNRLIANFRRLQQANNVLTVLLIGTIGIAFALASNLIATELERVGPWSLTVLVAIIAVSTVAIMVTAYRLRPGQVADDIDFGRYYRTFISSPHLLGQLNAIRAEIFGGARVDDGVVARIVTKNDTAVIGLMEAEDEGDRLVGYASCWPIEEQIHAALRLGEGVQGGLSERNFKPEHVLGRGETRRAYALFVPGLAVLDSTSFRGKVRTVALCYFLLKHIQKAYAERIATAPLAIFLVGFTPQGRSLTAKLAGHLGMADPAGWLILHDEHCPYFEGFVDSASFDRVEKQLLRALMAREGAVDEV